ncbi:MAG: 30S ribosomal protein S2 [Candidatus Omnitrophica bacterium]|nr:30S ribosomal protein S2 [Candidatus Omnitrophota bacterium]
MKLDVTLKQLLEAGVHFGHQTERWNPKMQRFIFGARNGIYIVDLEKTLKCIESACVFLNELVSKGQEVIFVGTKRQAKDTIKDIAQQCGMHYVAERWLGGTLTNFETIRKSVARMEQLEKMAEEGTLKFFTKKEAAGLQKEREKLSKNLEGIRRLKRLPGALFIIDPKKEENAVKEAIKLNVPVVALIDTNSDPDLVTYPLPGNDDAIRSIRLIATIIGQVVSQARQNYLSTRPAEELETVEGEAALESVPVKAIPAIPAVANIPASFLKDEEAEEEIEEEENS